MERSPRAARFVHGPLFYATVRSFLQGRNAGLALGRRWRGTRAPRARFTLPRSHLCRDLLVGTRPNGSGGRLPALGARGTLPSPRPVQTPRQSPAVNPRSGRGPQRCLQTGCDSPALTSPERWTEATGNHGDPRAVVMPRGRSPFSSSPGSGHPQPCGVCSTRNGVRQHERKLCPRIEVPGPDSEFVGLSGGRP